MSDIRERNVNVPIRCGFTIRLKRLKPRAPNFEGPKMWE